MKRRWKKGRKKHLEVSVLPGEPLHIFDLRSRFDLEVKLVERGVGRMALDFFVPGSVRVVRGGASG